MMAGDPQDAWRGFHRRWSRWVTHWRHPPNLPHWSLLLERILLLLELMGACEVYELLAAILRPRARRLRPAESRLARAVFGDALDLRRIRINEHAWLWGRFGRIWYVSFHWINGWGPLSRPTLVHELVHVWQYQQMGAVYIVRALRAQWSKAGYDYGGTGALRQLRAAGRSPRDLNLEQQAALVEDAYRLLTGLPLRWAEAGPADRPIYRWAVGALLHEAGGAGPAGLAEGNKKG